MIHINKFNLPYIFWKISGYKEYTKKIVLDKKQAITDFVMLSKLLSFSTKET
jgi:hypothetical protein